MRRKASRNGSRTWPRTMPTMLRSRRSSTSSERTPSDSQQIGIVMGAFAIGLLLSRAWLSHLADQRGRKIVLLIGMSAIALAPLGYLMIQSLPIMMAIRAFHGISIAAFATAYSALVVDLSPPQNRGELIGYMSLVNPLGLGIGPALGGYLQADFGYDLLFWVSAGLGLLGLICTMQIQETGTPPRSASLKNGAATKQFWRLLGTPRIRIPAAILLLVGLMFGTLSTFVPLFMREVGISLNVGLFYTAGAIASFSIRLLTGPASDRYGRGRFITLSLMFYGASMVMLWSADSASAFLWAGIAQGAGSGTLIPMMAALMADRSQAHERGVTFGLCMVGFDVGIAIAGPTLGLVADLVGYRHLFGLSALLALLGIIIFITLSSKDMAHSVRFALTGGRDIYALEPDNP
ncbi:MAG: MFS transporter [Cyanothece sp. SIO1E1]|nr:MFS transporter [Cyanothece sp. SIO1E1]